MHAGQGQLDGNTCLSQSMMLPRVLAKLDYKKKKLEMKSCLLNVRDCKSFGLWLSVNEMTTECFARKDEDRERGRKTELGRKRGGKMMIIMAESLNLFGGLMFFFMTKCRWQ